MSKKICPGCGKEMSSLSVAFIMIGIEEVAVCGKYSGVHRELPKATCARKAREKASLCPGCGKEKFDPGTICHTCKETIDRYSDADDSDVEGYLLSRTLLGPYLSESSFDEERPSQDLLVLLTRIAAPKGVRRRAEGGAPRWARGVLGERDRGHTGMPAVELDSDQKEALLLFGEALQDVMKAHRLEGFGDGESVLHRIMSGEMTVDDINEMQVRKSRLYGND